ncbi:hypothetical protein B0A55_09186 [Friedmanniomyces simplex]|uniref:Uncharacterized protein n=1 Tax=Friedmanniomyces simplex TaxID=329884 RepID=A0A4U0WX29_9PEZI|nr:hypothetical protein B0A55_09186 [Friedmanniomyces simplex]
MAKAKTGDMALLLRLPTSETLSKANGLEWVATGSKQRLSDQEGSEDAEAEQAFVGTKREMAYIRCAAYRSKKTAENAEKAIGRAQEAAEKF